MIGQLKRNLIGVGVGALSIAAVYFYWQHVTSERDAYKAEAEHQRERAEILIEHQQLQRQRINTLSSALAARERTLETIDDDIGASTGALEPLGEQDAKAGDWLDSDLPDGIVDWVRELQRSVNANGMR
ncbi:hypothetical protein QEN58_09760 [Halomonas alkaliantarctica]|uniref:LysB family phage lysis regulatory protein n=1 Tax=Halomonas alkaliantarctica TaxID=232346 RepID=A0ABY8LK05_9GAMM|nr:hypothetical protein [Halomonas alkaliantarctica]WGI23642.1 hypothetical protein QEN58_09760 [Halomonas alkaliantarctica]